MSSLSSSSRVGNKFDAEFDMDKYQWSAEQQKVLDMVEEGGNVFFTGAAGMGKSCLLKEIIKRSCPTSTFVTALTGIAAVPLDGMTLHRFAGIGIGKGDKKELLESASRKNNRMRWKACKRLIIDEISMCPASLFEKLDFVAKELLRSRSPFGGIQLVVCGDFFQLPPVFKSSDEDKRMVFESKQWQECISMSSHVIFTKIYRQTDNRLIAMLNEVRRGDISDASITLLKELKRPVNCEDGILPTMLYATNHDVDRENKTKLEELPGVGRRFEAKCEGMKQYTEELTKNCVAQTSLDLKIGAQVMMIVNDPFFGLSNGSRGKIVSFVEVPNTLDGTRRSTGVLFPVVHFTNSLEIPITPYTWNMFDPTTKGQNRPVVASISQIPLKLAWAITCHKSQGMSLDRLEVKIDDAFATGQAYCALSRATCLDGLRVSAFDVSRVKVDAKVAEFYDKIESAAHMTRQLEKEQQALEEEEEEEIEESKPKKRKTLKIF